MWSGEEDLQSVILVPVYFDDGTGKRYEVLIDTGAQVISLNEKLSSHPYTRRSKEAVRLVAANEQLLKGRNEDVIVDVRVQPTKTTTNRSED